MSSAYVRQLTEQWIGAIGTIPYYNTINQEPNPTEDLWLTLDFEAFGSTVETFCGEQVEEGEIRLIFLGRVGIGYDAVITAAEAFTAAFIANVDPTGQLVLLSTNPPVDFAGQNNPWFVIEIAVDYQQRSA